MIKHRCPELIEAELTSEQKQVFNQIKSGPRGRVEGPLRVWLHSPKFAGRAQALGQFARYDSSLPPQLSELAILVTARIWGSGYEWQAHAPIAQKAGLDTNIIERLALGKRPDFIDPLQAVVFAFSVEIHRDRKVSGETYSQALDLLGTASVVELVGICGYYTLISMTINAFEVPSGDGPELPTIETPAHEMFR